jgi:predicted Zn-dependent protease
VVLAVVAAGCARPQSAQRGCPLTPEQEIDVGRAATPHLEARFGGRLDPPAIQAYVRTVGERIGRAASGGQWPYRVTVLDSPQVGLFSLPGGPVFVTRGLVARLRTEGELAAVIAHQMAHAGADHDIPRLCDAFGPQILTDAAEAAGSEKVSGTLRLKVPDTFSDPGDGALAYRAISRAAAGEELS